MRIALVLSVGLVASGCIPGGGGGGGDDDEDARVTGDAAAVVDRGAPDPDDGIPPPDRGPVVDAGPSEDAAIDPDDGVPVDARVEADASPPVDEGVSVDEGMAPDMAPACVEGRVEHRPCGLNGRGEATRVCAEGRWSAWGCEDIDVCVDATVEARPCAGGEERRRCETGQWSDWGICRPPPVCEAGESEMRACGLNNRGSQSRTCTRGQWGAYGVCNDPDQCRDGATEGRACGLNGRGVESRTCAAGRWGAYGACGDPDACTDGEIALEPCPGGGANGERTCEEGQFGELAGCPADVLCPPAGVVRVGQPVEGVTDGASRAAARCGGNARGSEVTWRFEAPAAGTYRFDTGGSDYDTVVHVRTTCDDAATEIGCDDDTGDGNTSRLDLPLAARQAVTVFVDGYQPAANPDGHGAYVLTVTDVSACANGAVEERGCLQDNGVERRTCNLGVWSAWGACLCDAGDRVVLACGLNGRGQQVYACANGQFPVNAACNDPDVCTDGSADAQVCPAGTGVRRRQCVQGAWQAGPCEGAVCPAVDVAMIGMQMGTLVAGSSQLAGSCGTSAISTEDTWLFTAPAAGTYTFDTSGSAFDTVLYLRRTCGDQATQLGCDDDSGEGTASRLTFALAAGQVVTVVVDGYNGRVGDYVLTIADDDVGVCAEEVSEPNDDIAQASLIEEGFFGDPERAVGALCGGDPDFYRYPVAANCLVVGQVTVEAGATPELAIYSPDGMLVDATTVEPLAVSGRIAAAGDWYFSVTPQDGDARYTLDVEQDCAAP